MTALYAAMLAQQHTAPTRALRWEARHRWIAEHPGWRFEDYDNARAGDILGHEDYQRMRRTAEKQALDKALEENEHGR